MSQPQPPLAPSNELIEELEKASKKLAEAHREVKMVVLGQDETIRLTLTALASGGHILLVGLPGLAKTKLVTVMAKVLALKARIAQIHPECEVQAIEEFVDEANVGDLLDAQALDGVIDCCDQVRAKAALAAWSVTHGKPMVSVGAAGGKTRPQLVEVADLSEVTHDPLLASLRQRWRQRHGGARRGKMGLRCVFSREAVLPPQDSCDVGQGGGGSLNCAGYGSSVTVTATFGMVAAAQLIEQLLLRDRK